MFAINIENLGKTKTLYIFKKILSLSFVYKVIMNMKKHLKKKKQLK